MAKIRLVADSKPLFRATILLLLGLAVFLLLNYSSRFFNRDASVTDQTVDSELAIDKRTIGEVDYDIDFIWPFEYDNDYYKKSKCSYFQDTGEYFCVPNFVVVGGRCSGQQRLYNLLRKHQQIYDHPGTNYFSQFGSTDNLTYEDIRTYVQLFRDIASLAKTNKKKVFGDVGEYLVHDYKTPGHTHSGVPRTEVLQFFTLMNKGIKVFYAVHNPVAMFECCWCSVKNKNSSTPDVNEVAESAIDRFKDCHPPHSDIRCLSVWNYLEDAEKCIIPGFDYYFYNSLLGTVQYKNIKIVHLTDLTRETLQDRMNEYSDHLGIDHPSYEALGDMLSMFNSPTGTCAYGKLNSEVETKLYKFYKNVVEDIADVADDPKFLTYIPRDLQ